MRSDLSFMVVRGLGKVRRFKASSFLLLGSALFFAGFILFSVFAINGYFAEQQENADLKKEIAALGRQQSRTHQRLARIRQQVAVLKDYILILEKPSAKASPEAYSGQLRFAGKAIPVEKALPVPERSPEAMEQAKPQEVVDREKAPTPEKQANAKNGAEQAAAPQSEKPSISIQDFTFDRKNTRLSVSFRLVSKVEDVAPLQGYLHMVIVDRNVDPPQIRSFPHEVLKDGFPMSYNRGQLFVIKHFKTVRGKFFLGGTREAPASLRVIVYNKDGLLLLDSELPLKNAA
jgi:hypothetical protein